MHKIDIGSAELSQVVAVVQIFCVSDFVSKLQPLQEIANYGVFPC